MTLSYTWRCCTVVLGVLSIASGVYLYLNWIDMFTRLRGKEMALSPTSPSYPGWKVSPLPLDFDVYLFNWTNPEYFYVGSGVKPHFEQLGPYRFRENPDKVDIEWHTHNHSVSFRKQAFFIFDAEGSKGSLDDKITTVNTVSLETVFRAKDGNYFQKKMLQHTLKAYNEGVTVTKTANEMMFKGYLDPLVTMGSFLSMFSDDIKVPYDRMGYFYARNNSATYDGHINMYTGADDISKLGQIHTWNHMTNNGKFAGECGDVKGSMGEFFPPNLSTNDSVFIYLPNICRAIPLDYSETVKIHGVTAYKFSGGERSIDNGTLYPEAKCYCVNDKCQPSGVFSVGPCQFNTSVFMSYPHFYKADPSYLEAVDGLSPDKEKHEFFMALEPNAGVVMDVGGGFQANFLIQPVQEIDPFENIPQAYIPLMWCEERVRVTPEIAQEIALVPLIVLLGQIVTGILFAGGIILIFWYPTKLVTHMCRDPKKKSALLSPLVGPNSVMVAPLRWHQLQQKQKSAKPSEGVPMPECKNGSFLYPNDTMTESLLSDSRNMPVRDDVIAR